MRWLVAGTVFALVACGAPEPSLISASQIEGDTIPLALTAVPGDAGRGKTVFESREIGHCVLCHAVDALTAEFQGNVGPDLSLVGDRLNEGQLRLRIVDYQIVRPGTLMPSYYRIHDLYQVGEAFEGAPILTAQEVEDLVGYLSARRSDDER